MKIEFIIDSAHQLFNKSLCGEYPEHLLYGAFEFKSLSNEYGKDVFDVEIKDPSEKLEKDVCIMAVPKHVFKCLGAKQKILINLNSNHQIKKSVFARIPFFFFDKIVCLSSIQVKDLVRIGIPRNKISVIPLGINTRGISSIKNIKKHNHYITSGLDAGRIFDFKVQKNIKVLYLTNETRVPYYQY